MDYRRLHEASLGGKRVILRAGFDLPMEDGRVLDRTRVEALLPTMRAILDGGASLVVICHQGRPKDGPDPQLSQRPIADVLAAMLGRAVQFSPFCIGPEVTAQAKALKPGEVLLTENLRFHRGEKKNDPAFAKVLANLGDVYVNDAFANSHRPHASMVALAQLLPSYMGLQLEREIAHLSPIIDDPRRPLTLIVGGAKMETKVPVIERFLRTGDDVLVGGAVANTFAAARGFDIGSSRYEEEQVECARELMLESEKDDRAKLHVPRDVVAATEAKDDAECIDVPLEDIEGDMRIFDVGAVTTQRFTEIIQRSGMIVWNGPLGFYEHACFAKATLAVAKAVIEATTHGAVSIIGGGDTIDAHIRYAVPLDGYTFVSTGGGAMLEFVSGKPLPALEVLRTS